MPDTGMHSVIRTMLNGHLEFIGSRLDRDAIAIFGPIMSDLERRLRDAITSQTDRRQNLVVILHTPGGVVEVVERMVDVIRHFYSDVQFVIPDQAMSAGTILAMSGDSISMDYFSVLGPIDPQVVKDDRLVPALSYLVQYERLIERDRRGELTSAEYVLLGKLDLGELHQYEQARNLSTNLLRQWLVAYKFKGWTVTAGRGLTVTDELREERAEQIARVLSDNGRLHSHGRGISRKTLQGDEIKLKIEDLGDDPELQTAVREYHHCLNDFMAQTGIANLVHSRSYL